MIKKSGLISIGLLCLSIFLVLGIGKNYNESVSSENRDSTEVVLYTSDTENGIFKYDLNCEDKVSVKVPLGDGVVYDKITLYVEINNGQEEKIETLHTGNDIKKDESTLFLEKDITQSNYTYFEVPDKGEYVIYCIGTNRSKKESFLNLDITIDCMLKDNEAKDYILTH